MGKNLQDIINAANLQPNYGDTRCYSALVKGMNDYFKTMTDTATEHEAFQAMTQASGESIVSFHARLAQKVRLCGYSPSDQIRFILSQLLKGMENRELAMAARTYGHDANLIVRAATRVEAFKAQGRATESSCSEVHAVERNQGSSRDGYLVRKYRKVENNIGGAIKKIPEMRGSQQECGQGRRNRCWRCGFTFHKRNVCPALGKRCNSCGRTGHYAAMCRTDIRQKRINNLQEERSDSILSNDLKNESNNDQV